MSQVKCGRCTKAAGEARYHASVAEVKACYAASAAVVAAPARVGTGTTHEDRVRYVAQMADRLGRGGRGELATDKQVSFIKSLVAERPSFRDAENLHDDVIENLTRRDASNLIDRLLSTPKEVTQQAGASGAAPQVPNGRYALEDEDGVVKFYRVNTPAEGRWAGFTFVDAQASDDLHPIRNRQHKAEVLEAIAADPAAAARRYGVEIGSCGICGRTLTDEVSRAHGIGPVCRAKTGW